MTIFKCKMCGGTIEFQEGATVGVCDSCGTKQTLPHLNDDRRINLYDRANHFRRNNEFDKAEAIYEQILTEDTTDAEAYWSLVLCQYGIEYVEDPATHKRVPTVNRAQFTSIFDDDNYKSALQYADGYQRELYEKEAKIINDIQKGILAISQKEEPFDVFICYKETDNNGRRTPDSVLANELYHQLKQEGFKVFFARITLEDKLGTAYEPYIFAALNSAKVMVVIGTKPEYFKAVWVKNEWSRYLALVKKSSGKKILIPAYKEMDPYDLPEEFSHLQAQDMSRLGFMQDLIRGIRKIAKADEPKATVKETVVVGAANVNIAPLLERAFLFLEDGKWQDANIYCEKVLDIDPKNAEAYLGKLMAELQVRSREQLADCADPFDNSENYGKVLRFGDETLENEMRSYIVHIKERNENARLIGIYNSAVSTMNNASSEAGYKMAAETFKTISGFQDADALAEQCLDKAEICCKNSIYTSARAEKSHNTIVGCENAIKLFESISGYRDTDEQIYACQRKIEEIKAKEEERERQAEHSRIIAEKAAKKRKKIAVVAVSVVIVCIIFIMVLNMVIIPALKLNKAKRLMDLGDYETAYALLEEIGKNEVIASSKYDRAVKLIDSGDYEMAYTLLEEIGKNEVIASSKYDRAVKLIDSGDYEMAYTLLEEIDNNEDIASSKYDIAVELIDSGDYEMAYLILSNLDYKDSSSKLNFIKPQYQKIMLSKAQVGSYVSFGSYEQDNDTSNGKEDIEWLVLVKEESKALVISKYVLDRQRYNTSNKNVTWETCSLRGWLNSTFISIAFSSDEQNSIISSTVTVDGDPSGNNTTDRIFLLSISEAKEYFSSDSERKCDATAYVIAQEAITNNRNGIIGWWLRSPGYNDYYAAFVSGGAGDVYALGRNVYGKFGVRPAMWINLST